MRSRNLDAGRIQTICFHGIGQPGRDLEPGEERFWIDPTVYSEIVSAIRQHPRRVDITFDDGNASDAEIGLPALLDGQLSARFFIITDRIDAPGTVSTTQLRELAGEGMTFGTHGASHRPWPALAEAGLLDDELVRSRRRLTSVVGEPIDQAAMPQGLYNRAVLTTLRRHGFTRAYSVDEGWSQRRSWLRTRYSVIHTDTPESITALLDNPNLTAPAAPIRAAKRLLKRWM